MFELDRFHSQALTDFGPRKLAMSLLGGQVRFERFTALINHVLQRQLVNVQGDD